MIRLFFIVAVSALPFVALAGSGYTPPVSASSVSGLGTAALLDGGTGISQVVQLTPAAKLPPVDGSLLTGLASSGSADWANGAPTLANWTDADSLGGADPVCLQTAQSGAVRMRTGFLADCSTAYGATDRAVGFLRTIAAGDFIVAFRLQFSRPGVARGTGSTALIAGAIFVDGSDAAANSWFGPGVYLTGSTLLNSDHLGFESTAGAARFTTYSAFPAALVSPSYPEADYILVRSGTTLTAYVAPARSPGYLIATYTVTAGAGMVGVRSQTLLGTADEIDVAMTAYRQLTELPW